MNSVFVAGFISVFHCPEKDPKWSFAETNSEGRVLRVAEKDPISEWATTGYYYWKDGKQFIRNAKQMIEANDRVNNEFYTCPVYNYTIKECNEVAHVVTVEVDRMQGIGTPKDLEEFIK
jgi:dTDP-glucose pyrophosphorylase